MVRSRLNAEFGIKLKVIPVLYKHAKETMEKGFWQHDWKDKRPESSSSSACVLSIRYAVVSSRRGTNVPP